MFNRTALSAALALAAASSFAQSNSAGLDATNFDTTTPACTDFYQHANGGWLKNNPVPAAYSVWGTFDELGLRNNQKLQSIAREAATRTDATPDSPEGQVGAFFAAAMDEASIERLDAQPLAADFADIEAIDNRRELAALISKWQARGGSTLFGTSVRQDLKDNTRIILYASQGGIGLPNSEFYTRTDAESLAMLDKYRSHVARMLELSGMKARKARKQADAIVALESRLAAASLPREALRDPNNSYNIVTLEAANEVTPDFDWRAFFKTIRVDGVKDFSLSHPKFFAAVQNELDDTSLNVWKAYLRWHLVNAAAPNLSKRFADADFAFFNTTLRGQKEQKPRDQRTIDQMNAILGDPLGQLFVAKHFPPQAKARMMVMIGHLKASLRARLDQLPWMGEATRAQAIE